MSDYDAVVFDADGVLVELTPMDLLREAVREAFAAVGVPDPDDRFVELAAAHEDLDALEAIESTYDVTLDRFWSERERQAIAHQQALIRDGGKPIYDDVARLTELDAALGVVSNNQQATVETGLAHNGIAEWFDAVYGREPTLAGASKRKPDPHYLDRALDDIGTRDALYVGDSETDLQAARRAGVDAAFLRRPHRADATLSVTSTYEVATLGELVDAVSA